MNKIVTRSLPLVGLLALVGGSAHAAVDMTAITSAQTDALAVAAALLAMGIAVWGALYVKRKFFG